MRLSRNFGKEAALTAGIEHARGDAIIVIDADLQDPPELIPQMLSAWQDGADVVAMKRRSRAGETALKRWSAHVFYRLLSRISAVDIPHDTGDFRLHPCDWPRLPAERLGWRLTLAEASDPGTLVFLEFS